MENTAMLNAKTNFEKWRQIDVSQVGCFKLSSSLGRIYIASDGQSKWGAHQAMLVYCDESKSQSKFWHYLQHLVATWQKKIQPHNLKNLVKSQLPCQARCRNDLLKPDVVIVMLHENWSDYWWRMLSQCCQYFVISDGEGLMYPSQIRHIPYHRDQKENKSIDLSKCFLGQK